MVVTGKIKSRLAWNYLCINLSIFRFSAFFFLTDRPTHFHEREGDGKQKFYGDGLSCCCHWFPFYEWMQWNEFSCGNWYANFHALARWAVNINVWILIYALNCKLISFFLSFLFLVLYFILFFLVLLSYLLIYLFNFSFLHFSSNLEFTIRPVRLPLISGLKINLVKLY